MLKPLDKVRNVSGGFGSEAVETMLFAGALSGNREAKRWCSCDGCFFFLAGRIAFVFFLVVHFLCGPTFPPDAPRGLLTSRSVSTCAKSFRRLCRQHTTENKEELNRI